MNDSSILSDALLHEEKRFRHFFRNNDVYILDRRFRDALPTLEALGYKTHMPDFLLEGHNQLTTLQSNKTRCVTMCRWVVQIVNGRIKRDFKLLRQDSFNRAMAHVMHHFKIACALLNKFQKPIEDRPEDQ